MNIMELNTIRNHKYINNLWILKPISENSKWQISKYVIVLLQSG